ncbi:MAG: hypothetical protein KatS3mg083_645 [Candidatus Dojkabacteria bacterium]|nr:MAG: hypothetical protein KatS3mg083_645 [Candidatus Dojkabacteria bacterium]
MIAWDIIIPSAVGALSAWLTYTVSSKRIRAEYDVAHNEQLTSIIETYREEIAKLKETEEKHRNDIYRLQQEAVKMQRIIASLQMRILELESELKKYKS